MSAPDLDLKILSFRGRKFRRVEEVKASKEFLRDTSERRSLLSLDFMNGGRKPNLWIQDTLFGLPGPGADFLKIRWVSPSTTGNALPKLRRLAGASKVLQMCEFNYKTQIRDTAPKILAKTSCCL